MRLEDLPPAMQNQVRAQIAAAAFGEPSPAAVAPCPRPSRRGGRWTCHRCGESFKAYAPCERHVDAEHHAGRIEWSAR